MAGVTTADQTDLPELEMVMLQPDEFLFDELGAFCEQEAMPWLCVDDLLMQPLTYGQKAWLVEFSVRWRAFMGGTAVHGLPLKTPLELAGEFVTTLREAIPEEMFALCLTAGLDADDACDSNVVMGAAFARLHKRETWLPSDVDEGRCTQSEADGDLEFWNAAAAIVRCHFGRLESSK
jgi:hypothetical protein